ncbi:MAG: lamin tail domain-containing protein, partial [Pseudomonadota bacterium]|nr:lamin tail domain-containing protein [Pseudomonadota bacterium]
MTGTSTSIVINEIHYDVGFSSTDPTPFDANRDGTRSASEDEFVEIVNTTSAAINISGWTLSDDDGGDFVFPAGTTLQPGQALVLFGGGNPPGDVGNGMPNSFFGGALVFVDDGSIGSGLSNSGDLIELRDAMGQIVDSVGYENAGASGMTDAGSADDESVVRDPDLTGSFVAHSAATDAAGALFSPGTQVDGSAFEAPVTIVLDEGFETDGTGTRYTFSSGEGSDGFSDFFVRTDGSNISSSYEVSGQGGDFFFAAQDIDSVPGLSTDSQQSLFFSGLDISGLDSLFFTISIAEDDSADGNDDWDQTDSFQVFASIDGGPQFLIFAVENDDVGTGSGFNGAPLIDTDLDGVGDGTEITSVFQTFSAAIAGTGSTLDLELRFQLNSGDEDLAIDNIIVSDAPVAGPQPGTFSVADITAREGDDGTTEAVFTVTRSGGSDGAVSVDFNTSAFLTDNATFGDDFTPLSGTLNFADGETSQTITYLINGDTDIEGDERFGVLLTNATGGATIDALAFQATATIINDDFPPQGPAEVFINEIHYDNSGSDLGEGVEVAGPAGTDLSGWSIVLYNGNGGGSYRTESLTGTIPDQDDGFGTLNFAISGIQNGGPDGIALVNPAGVAVQFLSYEGSFIATDGPAAGMTSEDIGVSEAGVPAGTSLQLGGTGFVYDDFTWQPSQTETAGGVNTGQDFVAANPNGVLFVDDASVTEGDSGTSVITFNVFRVGGTTGAVSADYSVAFGSEFTSADASDLSGVTSGTVNFADGDTLQTISIEVVGDVDGEPNEFFDLVLSNPVGGVTISDGTAEGAIVNDDPLVLLIGEIQGAGHTSPYVGNDVITGGLVTAVASNGFYMQTVDDGDSATSDAIFVFTGAAPTVSVLDVIQVEGRVEEFQPGGDPSNLTITQIVDPVITPIGVADRLPDAVVIGPNGITPPTETIDDDGFSVFDPENDGIDFWESLEGMLVTVENPVAVDSTNGFGELWTVASDGEGGLLASNVSDEGLVVIDGGAGGLGEFDAGAGSDFNPERIQIDEAGPINGQIFEIPDVLPGAVLNDVTGIVTYAFENYQVLPTGAVTVAQNPTNIAEATALVQGASNQLSVATYNVLNLDINEADGDTDIADGRFAQVATDIAVGLDTPDIVVLQEVQDDSGSANDGTTSAVLTLQALADEIFTQTGIRYEVLDNPFVVDGQTGGQPGGNIRVAMLYNPDRVTLDNASVFTVTEPGDTALNSAFANSRAPLGANFTFNGQTVTVIGNHFTSKIGSDNTFSGVQPPANAGAVARAAQAAAVNELVDGMIQSDPNAQIVVVGDFNEFQFEEPMQVLTGELDFDGATVAAGANVVLENLTNRLDPEDRFSVLFQGNAQALDHILATGNLADDAQIDAVHVNTPLGNPGSDHDPMLAVFNVGVAVQTGSNRVDDVLAGNDGDDLIDGLRGDDLISGNGGDDDLRFAEHFTQAGQPPVPVIEVSGRSFPVEVEYRPP